MAALQCTAAREWWLTVSDVLVVTWDYVSDIFSTTYWTTVSNFNIPTFRCAVGMHKHCNFWCIKIFYVQDRNTRAFIPSLEPHILIKQEYHHCDKMLARVLFHICVIPQVLSTQWTMIVINRLRRSPLPLYFSKRGAYWDRLCRDVVGWLSRACTVAKRCILGL